MQTQKSLIAVGVAALTLLSTHTSSAQRQPLPPGTIVFPGTGGPPQVVPQPRTQPVSPNPNRARTTGQPNQAGRRGRRTNTRPTRPTTPPWELVPGSVVSTAPAIGKDGALYFGSWNDKVYALDPQTGKPKWAFTAGKLVNATPAVGADGTVYVGSYDHKVYALDGGTGAKKWEFLTGDIINTTPAVGAHGLVYVGGRDHGIYALDAATGKPKWQIKTGASASSPVVGADGTVYVGADGIYALDGETGKAKWVLPNGFDPEDPLALGPDGTVYVGTQEGTLRSLDPTTGRTRWTVTLPGSISYPPAIVGNVVYVGADKFYALRAGDGRTLWQFGDGQALWSTPTLSANGTVYVGSDDKAVYSLAGASGSLNWKFTTDDPLVSFPSVGPNGSLLVASEGNFHIYALNSRSGRVLWQFQQDPVPPTTTAPPRSTRGR